MEAKYSSLLGTMKAHLRKTVELEEKTYQDDALSQTSMVAMTKNNVLGSELVNQQSHSPDLAHSIDKGHHIRKNLFS